MSLDTTKLNGNFERVQHLSSKGWKAKNIAKALGLSVATVYNYRNVAQKNPKPVEVVTAAAPSSAPLPETGDAKTLTFKIDKIAPDGRLVVEILCPIDCVNGLLDHLVSRYSYVKKPE